MSMCLSVCTKGSRVQLDRYGPLKWSFSWEVLGRYITPLVDYNYWVMWKKRSCGFHRIFTVVFERLFKVRLGYVIAPQGLSPPQEKSYCENTTKLRFFHPNYWLNRFDIQLNEPINQSSRKVSKVVDPSNKKTLI